MKLELLRKTDLAVRAMQRLGAQQGRLQGPQLADAIGTTPQFLGQVMAPLVASGWVSSGRGPTGGYELEADLSEVSMLEVIETVEGPIDNGVCVLNGGPCAGAETCALHEPWQRARNVISREFDETKLAQPDTGEPDRELGLRSDHTKGAQK